MSLECIVIVLMNNSLLGGQECTDYVDIQQHGDVVIGSNILAIIPRLNFTCNSRITSIKARMIFNNSSSNYPSFQVWRPASVGSTMYNKIGEVQLQSDDQLSVVNNVIRITNITLTGNDTMEVQSGDVVGYYHPPDARLRVTSRRTDQYRVYEFTGSHKSINLNNNNTNNLQALIQFTTGKCDVT